MVSSQRLVVHHEPGNASVLKVGERPVPQRKQGEVLVKQYGTSVSPVDYKIRAMNKDNLPKVLGGDISGIVEEADSDRKFRKGDRVFGLAPWFWMACKEVTYAEYAMCDWNIQSGSSVLVHAGSRGVGTWVVQLAKLRGAHVVATAGPKNQQFLKDIGADETIDYRSQDFAEVYKDKPFDYIFDSVGACYVTLQGKLKCIKDRSYDLFTQVKEAHEYLQQGHARGKVILVVTKE